jgi:outer membrane immunogenic protein
MTKTKIAIAFAAAFVATPGLAADLAMKAPAPIGAPWSWAGWYAGVNLGYGIGNPEIANNSFALPTVVNSPTFSTNVSLSEDGIIGGGQIGYNWQTAPNWLVGVEADFQGSGQKRTFNVSTDLVLPATDTVGVALDWFGTARARIGYIVNNSNLWYVTGGYAYGRTELSFSDNNGLVPGVVASGSSDKTMSGWTLGGGLESHLVGNWTAKLEYLYVDLGTISGMASASALGLLVANTFESAHIRDNIVRAGLNYKF